MNSTTLSDVEISPDLHAGPIVELTPTARRAVWASIISVLFLNQVAFNIGEFPAASDLLCYAFFAFYLLRSGHGIVSVSTLYLLTITIALALFRMRFSSSQTSLGSLLLLVVAYAPFVFRLRKRPDLQPIQNYILNAFLVGASIIAAIAIVQIVVVNAFKLRLLANIYFVLPEAIRGAGTYTFFREGDGGMVKANGFFLREFAELSTVTALGLLIEYRGRRRLRILTLLAAGLLTSLSGSGLTALAAAFLLPRSLSRLPVFVVSALGFLIGLYVLYSLDLPFLSPWFSRLSELTTQGTQRLRPFCCAMGNASAQFRQGPSDNLVGNGAGSFSRDVSIAKFLYEVSDPTWAKLTYEYGLVGLVLVSAILIIRLYSSALSPEIRSFYLFSWVVFPYVLKPGTALMIWLLTLVPSLPRQLAPRKFTPAAIRAL